MSSESFVFSILQKRKTSHVSPYGSVGGGGGGANNVGTTSGGNNIILNNNSHKQLLVNKTTKREKERHSEPSTSNQHVTQALPNQHGTADQHRRKSDNDKIVGDSDNEYKVRLSGGGGGGGDVIVVIMTTLFPPFCLFV